jgi:hypothetical protein
MSLSETRIKYIEHAASSSKTDWERSEVVIYALCEIARQLARGNALREFELGFGDPPEIESEHNQPDTQFSPDFLRD